MNERIYHHRIPAQLRFSDIDQLGHVNNAVTFSLYDMAKARYFTELFGDDYLGTFGMVVANVNANFFSPVYFTENIVIETAVTHLGNKSFTLHQRAVNDDTKEVKLECTTIMVGFDPETAVSMPLPEDFKKRIMEYEEMN